MKVEIREKKVEVINGKVVVTQHTEQKLTTEELTQSKLILQRRKEQLVEQSKAIKAQYDDICTQEKDIDNMILMLSTPTPDTDEPVVLAGE